MRIKLLTVSSSFVESMMLFGMGMILTKEEYDILKDVVYPCYAALGLANDFFSFDREYDEMQESGAKSLINAVWLYMQWHDVDVSTAKTMVREATNKYEKQFQSLSEKFRQTHAPFSDKLDRYLRALAYQISGNVVWSLNCPRYHPKHRYDPNAGLESSIMLGAIAKAEHLGDLEASNSSPRMRDFLANVDHPRRSSLADSTTSDPETANSSFRDDTSSVTSCSTSPDRAMSPSNHQTKRASLDPNVSEA
jgi:hypothetical protein